MKKVAKKESTHAGFEPTTFRESDFVPKSDALPLRQQAASSWGAPAVESTPKKLGAREGLATAIGGT